MLDAELLTDSVILGVCVTSILDVIESIWDILLSVLEVGILVAVWLSVVDSNSLILAIFVGIGLFDTESFLEPVDDNIGLTVVDNDC